MELMNDGGEAPRSLAKAVIEGLDGDVQNLRDVVGDAKVKNDGGETQQRSSPKVTERHETCDPGRSVQFGLSYFVKLLNTPVVI